MSLPGTERMFDTGTCMSCTQNIVFYYVRNIGLFANIPKILCKTLANYESEMLSDLKIRPMTEKYPDAFIFVFLPK